MATKPQKTGRDEQISNDNNHNDRLTDTHHTATRSTDVDAVSDRIDDWFEGERWDSQAGRYGPLIAVGLGLVLPWLSVTAPIIGNRSLTGIDTDMGVLVGVIGLAVLGIVRYRPIYQRRARLIGGGIMAVFAILYLFYLQDQIDAMYAQLTGNPFAGTVSADIGMGLYITFIAAACVAYGGYKSTLPDDIDNDGDAFDTDATRQ